MAKQITLKNLQDVSERVKRYVDDNAGTDNKLYIWDTANPASYDEIKAIVEGGQKLVIIKRNGHYYYPFQYGVNEYPGEPELPCEFSAYFTSGTNYRYILNYQCDSDKTDQPMTAVVDRSEEVAAKISTSVYSNIDSASSYVRFGNYELKTATGINNSTKEKLEFTFKSASDQLVKTVPLFPAYQMHDNGANGNFQLVGSVKTNNTTYNLYSFYMQTGALPDKTTATYSLSSILSGYTVQAFTEVSGVTSSGAVIGGVTDGGTISVAAVAIDSSGVTLRANSNMSSQTAILKITFMGSKN